MGDELQIDTQQHYEFISHILEVYGKLWRNIMCLVEGNVRTNKSLSSTSDIPIIGCCSHRFNLAVNDILCSESDIIFKVNKIYG